VKLINIKMINLKIDSRNTFNKCKLKINNNVLKYSIVIKKLKINRR